MKKKWSNKLKKKRAIIACTIIYIVAKIIVAYTPSSSDDHLPEEIRDQIKMLICVTSDISNC